MQNAWKRHLEARLEARFCILHSAFPRATAGRPGCADRRRCTGFEESKDFPVRSNDLIAGRYGEVNYKTVPSVIYTAPEIAWVGQTEEQVKASGRACKIGVFPFLASGRARAMESTAGFAKVIAAADDDELLGVHVIGPMAGELIAEAVLALEYSASAEDLQRTIHAHPTLSEAIHEAALAADRRAIDFPNR